MWRSMNLFGPTVADIKNATVYARLLDSKAWESAIVFATQKKLPILRGNEDELDFFCVAKTIADPSVYLAVHLCAADHSFHRQLPVYTWTKPVRGIGIFWKEICDFNILAFTFSLQITLLLEIIRVIVIYIIKTFCKMQVFVLWKCGFVLFRNISNFVWNCRFCCIRI